MTGALTGYTCAELLAEVARFAGVRSGAVHCVAFGGFALDERATRIDHARAPG